MPTSTPLSVNDQKGLALSEPSFGFAQDDPELVEGSKGFAHILAVLFILGGIATGVYLVQSRGNLFTQFLPKAGEAGVFIVDSSGSDIEETENPNLSLKLIAPWPVVNEDDKSTLDLAEESTNSGQKIKQQKIKGSFVFPKGITFKNLKDKPKILTTCSKGKASYNKDGNKFSFKVDKGSAFCIKASTVPGYEVVAASSKEDPKPSVYLGQIAGVNCQNKKSSCSEDQKLLDLSSDSAYVFQYFPVSEPPPPFVVSAIVAENPNFTINVLQIPIVSNPQTIDYILSDSNPGTKLVYVKFIDSNKEEQIFKDSVVLINPEPPRTTFLVKPYLVYPADKPKYPEYEVAVKKYLAELQSWYKDKVGATFEMAPLEVKTSSYNYDIMRCDHNPYDVTPPSSECLNDPKKLDGNWGQYMNLAIHNGIEKWDERAATLVFSAGGGGYAGANLYPNYAGWAITGDWVLEPISGVENTWGIPCKYSDGWQCAGGVPGGSPAHELGHAFGVGHPNLNICPGKSIMSWHGDYPTVGFLPDEVIFLKQTPFFTGLVSENPLPMPCQAP